MWTVRARNQIPEKIMIKTMIVPEVLRSSNPDGTSFVILQILEANTPVSTVFVVLILYLAFLTLFKISFKMHGGIFSYK